MKRVHVLFFVPLLGDGGAEMALLRILNNLDRNKFKLSLALACSGGSYETALAPDVEVHVLKTDNLSSATLRVIRSVVPLRRVIQAEQPDIVCSTMDIANVTALLACYVLPNCPKVVITIQNTLSSVLGHSRHILYRLLQLLIPRLYPKADRIIAVSQGVAKDLEAIVPSVSHLINVIHNPCVDNREIQKANEPLSIELPVNSPLILACGRLTEQKGFLYLLEALVQVRQIIPAHLWIIGEGKQRQQLERKIQQLGLTECARLLGFQSNPYKYMLKADVFVLSSLFEGFPLVLMEAMACGAPVVATDCPSGPREIIEDGVNGILVPPANVSVLSEAIVRVLKDPELKQRLSEQGKNRAQDFRAESIADAYGNLFLDVLGQPAR